jgi:hypothetical protein
MRGKLNSWGPIIYIPHPNRIGTKAVSYLRKLESFIGIKSQIVPQYPQPAFYPKM